MAEKIYQGDYGVLTFVIDTQTSLVGCDTAEFYVTKPGGTEVIWDLTIADEDDGITEYAIQENDLDEVGRYSGYVLATFTTPVGEVTGTRNIFNVYARGK